MTASNANASSVFKDITSEEATNWKMKHRSEVESRKRYGMGELQLQA
jgi:hypothetical protein